MKINGLVNDFISALEIDRDHRKLFFLFEIIIYFLQPGCELLNIGVILCSPVKISDAFRVIEPDGKDMNGNKILAAAFGAHGDDI